MERKRKQYKFWLDFAKPDERVLAHEIAILKAARGFSTVVRNGIRLILDLRQGRTDVLQELFPWVLQQKEEQESPPAPPESKPELDEFLREKITRLEGLLLEQGATPIGGLRVPAPQSVPRPMVTEDDSELITVTKSQVSGKQVAENFLARVREIQTTVHNPALKKNGGNGSMGGTTSKGAIAVGPLPPPCEIEVIDPDLIISRKQE